MDKKRFGVMIDCSRNAVMNIDALKKYIDTLVSFGYNTLMLYTEDTYEVDNEPYFGTRRGKYTKEELKEINQYCLNKGVELIPCIQTLAHINCIFRWQEYFGIRDMDDVLLLDEDRTYQLIENMFKTLNECFSSNIVHIGMDEAFSLGRGKYLDKYGYKNRFEILSKHLSKVVEIGKKYGKQCIMWSDMFFRLATNGNYYDEDNTFKITEEIKNAVNKDVGLVFWDYYHSEQKLYDDMITKHKKLTENEIWFAGGAWTWVGFTPHNNFSLKSMIPAMKSCRKNNINDIIITMWGDNGGECSKFSMLPSLYCIKCVYDGIDDKNLIKEQFKKITGENFDDMMKLDLPDMVKGKNDFFTNPSKFVLYSDLFNGFLEDGFPKGGEIELKKNTNRLSKVKSKNYSYLFETAKVLCDIVARKYTLGQRIRASYKQNNKEELQAEIKEIDKIIKKVNIFYKTYKKQWYAENKPHGFDVQDIRIGGLIQRLKSCRNDLQDFISGDLKNIAELDEDLLPSCKNNSNNGEVGLYNGWSTNVTVNIL